MTDFLITTEPGEHHRLQVAKTEGTTNPLIFISTNSRTMGLSTTMAEELLRALMAVLHGGFDRAISETALQIEIADKEFRASRASPHAEVPSPSRAAVPQLGDL